jgi:hypothetical protein
MLSRTELLQEVNKRLSKVTSPREEKTPYLTSGGLLSPEGKLHLCGFQAHDLLAQKICKGRSENVSYLNRLLGLGWIALTRWNDTFEILAARREDNPPTVSQMRVLKEIQEEVHLSTGTEYALVWDVEEDEFND